MRVRLEIDLHGAARLAPFRDIGGSDALADAAVTLPTHGADQEMRLLADRRAAGRDRVEARLQRPQQAGELLGRKPVRRDREQIDELPVAQEPRQLRRVLRRRAELGVPGQRGVAGDLLAGESVEVGPFGELFPSGGVVDPGQPKHVLDQRRIVGRHEADRVAGLIEDPRAGQRQLDMIGLGAGAAAVQVDDLVDLRLERTRTAMGFLGDRRPREIDMDDGRPRVALELAEARVDPLVGGRLVVHVAVDARRDALARRVRRCGRRSAAQSGRNLRTPGRRAPARRTSRR